MKEKSVLVERLKKDKTLCEKVQSSERIILNYRWELHGGKNRAYLQLTVGEEIYHTRKFPKVEFDPTKAKDIVREELREIRKHLGGKFCGRFKCYFLKGESGLTSKTKERYYGFLEY